MRPRVLPHLLFFTRFCTGCGEHHKDDFWPRCVQICVGEKAPEEVGTRAGSEGLQALYHNYNYNYIY